MENYKKIFINYALKKKALTFGKFILNSNQFVPYIFNFKLLNKGSDLNLLGKIFAKELINFEINFNLLFGLAYNGIPIVTITSIILFKKYKFNVNYCFSRKKAKNHGEGGNLVGSLFNKKIILLIDIITDYKDILFLIKIINLYKSSLVGIVSIFNQIKNIEEFIKKINKIENNFHKIITIITMDDLISYINMNNKLKIYKPLFKIFKKIKLNK